MVVNPGDEEVFASFRVGGLKSPRRTAMHRSSEKEKCVELDPERERVNREALRFPAGSVTTMIFGYGGKKD